MARGHTGRSGARRTRWTAEQAEAHLEEWRRGGGTLKAYCASAGVQYERVRRWRSRLEAQRGPTLRELRVIDRGRLGASGLEIALPSGVSVRVSGDFDPERIAALVRGLRA
jgi:hypothetical protein